MEEGEKGEETRGRGREGPPVGKVTRGLAQLPALSPPDTSSMSQRRAPLRPFVCTCPPYTWHNAASMMVSFLVCATPKHPHLFPSTPDSHQAVLSPQQNNRGPSRQAVGTDKRRSKRAGAAVGDASPWESTHVY